MSAHEASRVFAAGRHRKSFVALDRVDRAGSDLHQARRVTRLVTAWAEPYLPDRRSLRWLTAGGVVVTDAGTAT
ncbi:MAG TPA: hypothetical protein VNO31_47540 [Umezawaea sp.]|nr:hypothetical protein [Umezawaea sp.]